MQLFFRFKLRLSGGIFVWDCDCARTVFHMFVFIGRLVVCLGEKAKGAEGYLIGSRRTMIQVIAEGNHLRGLNI